jgi:ELWxxDGT repeat protein
VAHDSVHGFEVWVTDGTTSGTHLLADINPDNAGPDFGPGAEIPGPFKLFGDKIVFYETDGTNKESLWITDGTAAGTHKFNGTENVQSFGFIDTPFDNGPAYSFSGTPGPDNLSGFNSSDAIFALAGKDTIFGLDGDDRINGGLNKDKMTGGAGKDIFDFDSVKDSGKTAKTRDVITDFKHGEDKIDLSDIDAKSGTKKNDVFKFIATAPFHDIKGEVHYFKVNNPGKAHDFTIVEADTNGDGHADFQIELSGLVKLTKTDFIL